MSGSNENFGGKGEKRDTGMTKDEFFSHLDKLTYLELVEYVKYCEERMKEAKDEEDRRGHRVQ